MCGFKAVKAISLAEKPDKEVKLSWKDRTVSGKVMSVKTHVFTCTWHPPLLRIVGAFFTAMEICLLRIPRKPTFVCVIIPLCLSTCFCLCEKLGPSEG